MATKTRKHSRTVAGIVLLIVCALALHAETPAGWSIAGKDPEFYEAGTDPRVLYKGAPSIYIQRH